MPRIPTLLLALLPAAIVMGSCGLPEVASSERTTIPDRAPAADVDARTDAGVEPPPLAEVDTEPVWSISGMSLQVIAEVPNAIAFSPRSGTLNYYIAVARRAHPSRRTNPVRDGDERADVIGVASHARSDRTGVARR